MVIDKYKVDFSRSELKSQGTLQVLLISSLGEGIKGVLNLEYLKSLGLELKTN